MAEKTREELEQEVLNMMKAQGTIVLQEIATPGVPTPIHKEQ